MLEDGLEGLPCTHQVLHEPAETQEHHDVHADPETAVQVQAHSTVGRQAEVNRI